MGDYYNASLSGWRADSLLFALLSVSGLFGEVGALIGSLVAGVGDGWRQRVADVHRGVVSNGGSRWVVSLRVLLCGTLAGVSAYGVASALMAMRSLASDEVRGAIAALIASLVPLCLDLRTRRPRSQTQSNSRGMPMASMESEVATRKPRGVWATWRSEVLETWREGFYLTGGVSSCSVGIAAMIGDHTAFGQCAVMAFLGGRPVVWLILYWASRRASRHSQ